MTDADTLLREAPAADWARPMAERDLAILGRLAEAGLEIAIALEAQAKGGDVVVDGDIGMAYARVARAVRQTLMLRSKLIADLQEQEHAAAGRKASARSSAARILKDAIEDDGSDKERTERLSFEAAERLEREDFGDFVTRPFGEIVVGIVRDLGLTPNWLALAQDCAAAERTLHAKSGPAAPALGDEDDEPITDIRWISPDPGKVWGDSS